MALYIKIRKNREDDREAEYSYGADERGLGLFVLDKKTGMTTLTKPSSGERSDMGHYERVAFKVRKLWSTGQLPEETCWAS